MLEKDKIWENPGRRDIAKICVNRLWGESGQPQKLKKTNFVTNPLDFYIIFLNDGLENIDVHLLNDNMSYNFLGLLH